MIFDANIGEHEYSEFVKSNKLSHFLKSYEWGQVCITRGFKPYYVGVRKDGKLLATALLLKKRLPFGYSYFYIPRGFTIDYTDSELLKFFTLEIAKFTKGKKSIFFKIDPDIKLHTIDSNAKVVDGENNYKLVNLLKELGFKRKKLNLYFENMQPRFTFRVSLTGSIDEIRSRYSQSVRRWIKVANKYNVETKIGTEKDLDEFINLMKMTEKRQGFYSHSYTFYPKLYDIFSKSNSISLMLATVNLPSICSKLEEEIGACADEVKKEKLLKNLEKYKLIGQSYKDKVVSSYINIHYGNKSWYLYGANDMDFKDTYANYKLFDYQIEKSKELGLEIFDEFGTVGDPNTKKSVGGLHEFKKKFGGEYTEFIGEFDYPTRRLMYFIFKTFVPLYSKILLKIRHLKVKKNKD